MQNDRFSDKQSPTGKSHKGYTDGSHSEIEVAAYSDWNADTIPECGLGLLDFLERRWNVKFPSDESKKDMLFLDFIPL